VSFLFRFDLLPERLFFLNPGLAGNFGISAEFIGKKRLMKNPGLKIKKNLPGKGGKETREALNDIQQTERITLAARLSSQKQISAHFLHHQYTLKITIKVLVVKVFAKLLPGRDFHSKITP
jgi:hypothetical protein